MRKISQNPILFWAFFALSYMLLGYLAASIESAPFGDVTYVYKYWVAMAANGEGVVGINSPWVYPLGAFVPMALAALIGGAENFVLGWFVLVVFLNFVSLVYLRSSKHLGARRFVASLAFVFFALLLGPVAVSRLDAVVSPLVLIGLAAIARSPILSGAALTAATWIKVWPAALISIAILLLKSRGKLIATSMVLSAFIAGFGLILGAGENVFSFLTQQANRGLQIESVTATPFLWLAWKSPEIAHIFVDHEIVTYQISAPGVDAITSMTNPILLFTLLVVGVTGVLKLRKGINPELIFTTAAVTLVSALITFNKVGSPQFIISLAAPVILYYCSNLRWSNQFLILGFVISLTTSLVFPYFYNEILELNPVLLLILTLRNIGMLALVVLSFIQLASLNKTSNQINEGKFASSQN